MRIMNWNSFETLMDIASGFENDLGQCVDSNESNLLINLKDKREELEKQRDRFRNADEDEILQEYQQLQHVHHEFLKCFRSTHNMLRQRDNRLNQSQFDIPLS